MAYTKIQLLGSIGYSKEVGGTIYMFRFGAKHRSKIINVVYYHNQKLKAYWPKHTDLCNIHFKQLMSNILNDIKTNDSKTNNK